MNSLYLLAGEVSKATAKRVFISIAVILLFIFVVIGLIEEGIKKWSRRKAKEIDLYVVDLCRVGILQKPKDVVKYVTKREFRNLYLHNRWWIRVFMAVLISFICIICFKYEKDFSKVLNVLKDLKWELDWPVGTFWFFKKFPLGFPTVIKSPIVHLNLLGYTTYVMLVTTIVVAFKLIFSAIFLTSKLRRARKIKVDAFNKTVDYNKGL